jgi:hypothetical protein
MQLFNEIFFYQINYFVNVMVIQNNVLRVILGRDIPFVYPNYEWTPLIYGVVSRTL